MDERTLGIIAFFLFVAATWGVVIYLHMDPEKRAQIKTLPLIWKWVKILFVPWYLVYIVIFGLGHLGVFIPYVSSFPSPFFLFQSFHLVHMVLLMITPIALIFMGALVHANDQAMRKSVLQEWSSGEGYEFKQGNSARAGAILKTFQAIAPQHLKGCRNQVVGNHRGNDFRLFDLSVGWFHKMNVRFGG